jgi:hypothetical protein
MPTWIGTTMLLETMFPPRSQYGKSITKLSFEMEIISKRIPLTAELKDYGQQKAVNLSLSSSESDRLVLLLLLLRERLADSIEIALDNFSIYLKCTDNGIVSKCTLFDPNKKCFKGSINMDSLEYAIYFLLEYFRDGLAETDHIDLDFEYDKASEVTLVIKVDSHKTISEEEMNKLLGL